MASALYAVVIGVAWIVSFMFQSMLFTANAFYGAYRDFMERKIPVRYGSDDGQPDLALTIVRAQRKHMKGYRPSGRVPHIKGRR